MALENYGRIMQGASDFAMQPYNALQDARRNQRTNTLLDLRAQQVQGEIDDDAEWDQALASRDVETMMRIAPRETQMIMEHWQGQKMSGLEEVPISRQKIDMAPLQRQENWAAEQAQQQRNADRNYRLNVAQESRMAAQANAPEQAPKPKAADIVRLRKEFRGLTPVKDYETVLPLLVSARNAPDTGYGDLQLIYTAGKVLDPGSVVREGELALTVAAGSPLQRVIGKTRFTTENGGRLTPETRKQLLDMLNERALALRQGYDREYKQYAEYGQASGMVPRDVVGRHAANAYQPTAPKSAPRKEAPQAAIDYLRANPNTKAAFFKKYGYVPDVK